MRSVATANISKKLILERINQIDIFSKYLNIPVELIRDCIDNNKLIISPLRADINPTCGFRYDNRGKLKFKDFAGYFWGDCFDIVCVVISAMYNRTFNVNNKNDFILILKHITFTFKDEFKSSKSIDNEELLNSLSKIRNKKPKIEVVTRGWNKNDIDYWDNLGVDIKTLNINFIFPIDQYYIDRIINPEPKYYYSKNPKDVCYAYYLGKDRYNIENIKLYFPNRDKSYTKFLTNCNILEGILNLNLDGYDAIIITKSTKDRVTLLSHYNKSNADLKIGFINIPHETYKLRQDEYNWLSGKLNNNGLLLSLMDNDDVGINQSYWLYDNFKIERLLIPFNYNAKDFSELVENYHYTEIDKIIKKVINVIKHKINVKSFNEFNREIKTNSNLPF